LGGDLDDGCLQAVDLDSNILETVKFPWVFPPLFLADKIELGA